MGDSRREGIFGRFTYLPFKLQHMQYLTHLPESDQFPLLKSFYTHVDDFYSSCLDFEALEDGQDQLNDLCEGVDTSALTVLGQHGSASLMAIWRRDPSAALETQPVVWMDSEGSPNFVIAACFADFVRLLPYGTGTLYDLTRKAERAARKPAGSPRAQDLEPAYFAAELQENLENEDEEGLHALVKWLADNGLAVETDPFAYALEVARQGMDFDAWILSMR